MNLEQHLLRQMAFSHATFGPGARAQGVCDHARKEIAEIEQSNGSPEEWVDLVILALDGLSRALAYKTNQTLRSCPVIAARDCCELLLKKQAINEGRQWPDWRTADTGKAIEHIKGNP